MLAVYKIAKRAALFVILPVVGLALDLSRAVVVLRPDADVPVKTAAAVLVEEVETRTGLHLATATSDPAVGTATIRIVSGRGADGFHASVNGKVLTIEASNPRSAIFAIGYLLRKGELGKNRFAIDDALDVKTAPAYPIRGHQLGYRATANSYDAWTPEQYEHYIRELAFFGANSVEGIPIHDKRPSPVMKLPRREMNSKIAEMCRRYGLDYWVWTPADIDLKDKEKTADLLARFDEMFADSSTLTGVFVPGGDPGDNLPELVMPFLETLAQRMAKVHPHAKIWLSLQRFTKPQVEFVDQYIQRVQPKWLGGLVAGPSSPPVAPTRLRLPKQYGLRLYPDLTHNKISQFQVPGWDQAYALTLGREAVNPRPAEMAIIHNWFAPYSDGFISYSDGAHDDVNKVIFTALSWNPQAKVRDILVDYARLHFGAVRAKTVADAILALEKNWRGSLVDNGSVEGTLGTWRALEAGAPELAGNWRWQMLLLRANYDAYVRRRLLRETELEREANSVLRNGSLPSSVRIQRATRILNQAVDEPIAKDLRARIEELCEQLWKSVGLQTSVAKYNASGEERGAVLDFVDYPLNNRYWLLDEFAKVEKLPGEDAKARRLVELANWETPGPGSFYDAVGIQAKSPHVFRGDAEMFEPGDERRPEPTFWWWDNGASRARLSWQATMWPRLIAYEGLDPAATYKVRTSGYGQCLLRINGERVTPVVDGTKMGEFKEFAVPARLLKNRKLLLTFEIPTGEDHLNWRQQSRLAEVWLLKQ